MKIGRQFAEERMYSKNEEERLYSTGNDELDELLERAFCEGYEYAQREYAEKKETEKSPENHRGLGRAYLIGGVPAMVGRHAGKKTTAKAIEEGKDLDEAENEGTKKAKKVGAATGAGLAAASLGVEGALARKVIKENKKDIKKALEDAGVKLTKKNKKAAMIGVAAGAAGLTAGAAGLGALGAKVGKKKNDKERRSRMTK